MTVSVVFVASSVNLEDAHTGYLLDSKLIPLEAAPKHGSSFKLVDNFDCQH